MILGIGGQYDLCLIPVQNHQSLIAVVKENIANVNQAALLHGGGQEADAFRILVYRQSILCGIGIKGGLQSACAEFQAGQSGVMIVFRRGNNPDSEQSAGIAAGALELHGHRVSSLRNEIRDIIQIFIEHIGARRVVDLHCLQQLIVDIYLKAAAQISGIPGASQVIVFRLGIYRQIVAPPAPGVGMAEGPSVKASYAGISSGLQIFGKLGVVVVKAVQIVYADLLISQFFLLRQDPVLRSLRIRLLQIHVDAVSLVVDLIVGAENQFLGISVFQGELDVSILAVLDAHQIFRDIGLPLIHRHILDGNGVLGLCVLGSHPDQNAVGLGCLNVFIPQFRRQNYRAVLEGHKAGIVGSFHNLHFHGHRVLDYVPGLQACQDKEAVLRRQVLPGSVYGDYRFSCQPAGLTQSDVCARSNLFYGKGHRILVGHIGILNQLHAQSLVLNGRAVEHIDVQGVPLDLVDIISQLGEVLHAGSGTAPELIEGTVVNLVVSRRHGLEIHGGSRLRILRSQNGVGKGSLKEIQIFGILGLIVESLGELQHVVGVAGLAGQGAVIGALGRVVPQLVRVVKMLALAVAAGDIGMMVDSNIPEILRGGQVHLQIVLLFLGQSVIVLRVPLQNAVPLHRSGKFGNGGIGMLAAEHILVVGQLLEQGRLVKALRRLFNVIVAGDPVQFIESFVHAAVLCPQHNRHIRQIGAAVVQVFAEGFRHFNGRILHICIIHVPGYIQQACQNLVQVVVRYQHSAVVRCGRGSSVHPGQHALREGRDIAGALGVHFRVCVLAFFQSVNSVADLLHELRPYLRIVLAEIRLGQSGHIMAEGMSPEVGRPGSLPAAVAGIRGGLKACHLIKLVEEFLGAEAQQVFFFFRKGVYQIIIGEYHLIHEAGVGKIQRLLGQHRHGEVLCLGFSLHKHRGGPQGHLCVRLAYRRSVHHSAGIHGGSFDDFPGNYRTLLSHRGKDQIPAGFRGNIQSLQILSGNLGLVNDAALLFVKAYGLRRGGHIVEQLVMVQSRVKVGRLVVGAVVADGFLHLRIGAQNTGGFSADSIVCAGGLGNTVAVDLHVLADAVVGYHYMGPLPCREELRPAGLHADFVGLALSSGRSDGKGQGGIVIFRGQIPAVGPPLIFVPGNDLLPGHSLIGVDPEGQGQIPGLQGCAASQIHIGAAGKA